MSSVGSKHKGRIGRSGQAVMRSPGVRVRFRKEEVSKMREAGSKNAELGAP